jgi:flagellar hook-associated protein 1 FlgK
MNMPSSGKITIGNHEYTYTGFTYDSTNKTYTFTLDSSTPLVADPQNAKATIGESVDYKGIPYYMNQLNQLVRTYANAFNNIHETGEDLNGDAGEYFFTGTDKVTGAEYDLDSTSYYDVDTSTDGYYNLTAANFTINAYIYDDPSKIAIAGSVTDGVEDKTVLDSLIDLKDDTSLFYSGTVASFFESIVSDVAVGSERAQDMYDSQTDVVNLVTNQRLSVSGVDTDEEAMDLVKFQNAYNLSSKVISIMNEVYDKLINETGV